MIMPRSDLHGLDALSSLHFPPLLSGRQAIEAKKYPWPPNALLPVCQSLLHDRNTRT